jgi:flagellar motility protein MotE (MotC chaperone)
VVEGRARTISVWLVMLMISLAAALAAASTGDKTDGATAGKGEGKSEPKPKAETAKPKVETAKPKVEGQKDDKTGEVQAGAAKLPAAGGEKEPAKDSKAAKAEAKSDAKTGAREAKSEAKDDVKKDGKAEAKDGKAEAKKDAKAEGKSDTKAEAKSGGKTDAKAEAKSGGKTDAKAKAKSGGKTDARRDRKNDLKTAGSKAPRSGEAGAVGEEPTGPLTPPLKLNALRDEMSRPPARHDEHAATKAEREKLEHLAAEINKAREGLRQDTAKLEAMLAARDAAPAPVASAGTPSSGDSGEPAKKVPLPIDTLAKAIRGMKPEQAAPIISRVDRKLAADVLLRMPGADAGKVMGVCKPEVAAELAAEIASRTPRAELRR